MSERFKCPIAVHLVFIKDNKILMQKRKDKLFNGMYSLPGGHVDGNERIVDAIIREAKEEIDLTLTEQDLNLATTYHSHFGGNEYMHFFFLCRKTNQVPKNCEENICELIDFFDIDSLPQKTLELIKRGIKAIKEKQAFIEDTFPF